MTLKPYSFSLLAAVSLLILSSCEDDNDGGTNPNSGVQAPATYSFERNGESTVSYSGQTTRLAMGAELNTAMLDFTKTNADLQAMFANADANGNDVDPFTDPALNASTKSLRSKTAASYLYFNSNATESATIKTSFSDLLENQVSEIFPNANQAAAAGLAGQIADGSSARYVSAQGLEYNQAFSKGLIGALVLDQIANNYLDAGVLDAGTNRADNDAAILLEGKSYTNMEHKWDEAYGYLFGGAADGAAPLATLGSDDDFLNKYLARVDADEDFTGIAADIFNAFKLGRAALVEGDYDLRDAQANIIREKLSLVVAVRTVYYLQAGKDAMAAGDTGTAFHDLSEAYGFVLSLRFTHNPTTGEPYFNASEVQAFIDDLMGDGPNGLWDVKAATLDAIANDIATRFNFSLSEAS